MQRTEIVAKVQLVVWSLETLGKARRAWISAAPAASRSFVQICRLFVLRHLGNIAVMLAALGVFGTGSAWPDLVVAGAMAALALWGAATVLTHARGELRTAAAEHY